MQTNLVPKRFSELPLITVLSVAVCVLIFLGLLLKNDYQNPATLAQFGCLSAEAIWRGSYWGLITSAFVHFAFWHVAFNLYWLWTLGRLLEKSIGSLAFLALVLSSAFVSSAFQLATDNPGIGASGVVYALFGFMWMTQKKYPTFGTVLDSRTITTFLVWLVGCFLATALKLWDVANAAHLAGLGFGMLVATALNLRYRPLLTVPALLAMVGMATTFLFWCPGSLTWLETSAHNAFHEQNFPKAITLYSQIIKRDPRNVWAYLNRSFAHAALRQEKEATADYQTASKLDPNYVEQTIAGLAKKKPE
jgi:rhomboid protease GluP